MYKCLLVDNSYKEIILTVQSVIKMIYYIEKRAVAKIGGRQKKLEYYIKIKDKQISIRIRNYKNTNRVKIYFRGDILQVSKPKSYSEAKLMKMIHKNEEEIYQQYCQIMSTQNDKLKHWYTGEQILYKGETYTIQLTKKLIDKIQIEINQKDKLMQITIPEEITQQNKKIYIDKAMKKMFKTHTEEMLQSKLPYWSQITGITYQDFKVRDTISKYGSCVPKTQMLHFNARLIMLPEEQVDAIIVHELCHIIHPNHSQDFYTLIKQYMPDYDQRNQWLKNHQKEMMI